MFGEDEYFCYQIQKPAHQEDKVKCPKCESENIEVIDTFPGIDYAEKGEYYIKYKCNNCGLEFQDMNIADTPMFD